MFERMFRKGYLNIEKILLENYSQLKLTERELVILNQLFDLMLTKKTISLKSVKQRVSIPTKDIQEILESLISKGFVEVNVEIKNGKQETCFDVVQGLEKIYEHLKNEKRVSELDANEALIKKIYTLCEEELEREISANDLITISHWVELKYSFDDIKWAILDSIREGKHSISYIDRVLCNGQKN